ncbi:NUDIX domain-containing protein [Paenibacillus sp. NPDC058071]|uniref:NUDIX hydrolase n=1 Tax=Paenibacillus sp. NPDC058071 TaxID=3346326 RepID=UPI0036DC2EF0
MAEEYFDIYDDAMNPIGIATRKETHEKGYWHRSFHCWLTRREGDRRFVRFQLRADNKDTHPGHYDITAAGHLTAGETLQDAVRELEEELGVSASFEQLIPLGEVREEAVGSVRGIAFIDREVSHVFGLICDVPLAALKLQPEEVAGVYEADLEKLILLFEGALPELPVEGIELTDPNTPISVRRTVMVKDFIPREPGYYAGIMRALRSCT